MNDSIRIDVKMGEDLSDTIVLTTKHDQNVEDVTQQFCEKHGLNSIIQDLITSKVHRHLDSLMDEQ